MELEKIHDEWESDTKIDKTQLGDEALKIPSLHHKYWKILSNELMIYEKLKNDLITLKKLKGEYYTGKISPEDLKEQSWEPFPLRILRDDAGLYINSDKDVINKNLRIKLQETKIKVLDDIIKNIHGRAWVIKAKIDFLKFENGQ